MAHNNINTGAVFIVQFTPNVYLLLVLNSYVAAVTVTPGSIQKVVLQNGEGKDTHTGGYLNILKK